MRDDRWVNRFLFAWNNTLSFDPLDAYYEPVHDHFISGLEEHVRDRFVRSGIWWSHRLDPNLPEQGWKIHVSAGCGNVQRVAALAVGYLTERKTDFKVALDINIFEMLSSKAMSRGSSGKLVTVYPRDEDDFRACLTGLAEVLDGEEGAYVLSDQRYRDNKTLYFRYGQYLDTHTVDIMGRPVPHILGPDGPVADERSLGGAPPWWVTWPFDDWKPGTDEDQEELLGGRFRVTGALQFSNGGGVYKAEDTADGDRTVVLKEARPHTNINPRQNQDAVEILHREWQFLNRLSGIGSYPEPVAEFRHWEHYYIAEEFIDGYDIRSLLLERNPLARPGRDTDGSREFLKIFIAVFRELAYAMHAAHERRVILGDFHAANLIIDPDSYQVTIVDLEAGRLIRAEEGEEDLEKPVELFAQGFSLSRERFEEFGREGDMYSLAATMAYFIFPIAAMSYLRSDVLEVYRVFTDALGWPERVHRLIADLAHARISLPDVMEALEDEAALLDQVRAVTPQPVVEEQLGLRQAEAGVGAFVEAVADTDRTTLFPVDPFAHVTNPLSLGFGASGVLWGLNASGVPVRPQWRDWLGEEMERLEPAEYPDGLMTGLSGIAWAADSLGFHDRARQLLDEANRRGPEKADHTFYYGLSGLGMTNLHFHLRDGDPGHLAAATECARILHETVRREGREAYWLNGFSPDGPLTGLGFGQAGVAMFLLRMYQLTDDEEHLRLGRAALDWEMAHAKPLGDDGVIMFDHQGTMEPYVEVGSAGVAQVLLRYGDLDAARTVLRGLDVGQAVLAGHCFGMSGVADTLLDAAEFTGDSSYRDMALRQLDFVRKVFLFEPEERFGIDRGAGAVPLAVPGEGLVRCSCDYLTGSVGVLRVLHRVNTGGTADFLLDEVTR